MTRQRVEYYQQVSVIIIPIILLIICAIFKI
jgi:hypothetical protein